MPFQRPPLMAIGDSLVQGCRSLSVTARYCQWSTAAQVARSQNWEFFSPDFPKPILLDFQDLFLNFSPLRFPGAPFILADIHDNIDFWMAHFGTSPAELQGQQAYFDNLGITGALWDDLLLNSKKMEERLAAAIPSSGPLDLLNGKANLSEAHISMLSRFTLNPSNNPDFQSLSAVDWVLKRNPERLQVQAGHNHGLYAVGGSGKRDLSFGTSFWDPFTAVVKEVATLTETDIYWFLLPKVGAVANLEPIGAFANGYAEEYHPVFSLLSEKSVVTGEELRAVDKKIDQANDEIRERVKDLAADAGSAENITFVDTFQIFDRYDFKNTRSSKSQITSDSGRITNDYLKYRMVTTGGVGSRQLPTHDLRLVEGGFQGLDGMHPSAAGYGLLAAQWLEAMNLSADAELMVGQGFEEDALLRRPTSNVPLLSTILRLAGASPDQTEIPESHQPMATATAIMRSCFD